MRPSSAKACVRPNCFCQRGSCRGSPLQAQYLGRSGGELGGNGFLGLAKWRRYQQSKLANLLFTYALHDHIASERPAFAVGPGGPRIHSLCAHPGPTDSGLERERERERMRE